MTLPRWGEWLRLLSEEHSWGPGPLAPVPGSSHYRLLLTHSTEQYVLVPVASQQVSDISQQSGSVNVETSKRVHVLRDIKLKTNDNITGNGINPDTIKVQQEKKWSLHPCIHIISCTFECVTKCHFIIYVLFFETKISSYTATKLPKSVLALIQF